MLNTYLYMYTSTIKRIFLRLKLTQRRLAFKGFSDSGACSQQGPFTSLRNARQQRPRQIFFEYLNGLKFRCQRT